MHDANISVIRPMHNQSPPFRQNSYPGPAVSQQQQQSPQQYGGQHAQQGYQQPSLRGNHTPQRGGQFPQQDPQRRFSGPGAQNFNTPPAQRARGGHFSNLQWTAPGAKRGGSQSGNAVGSDANSHTLLPPCHIKRHASQSRQ